MWFNSEMMHDAKSKTGVAYSVRKHSKNFVPKLFFVEKRSYCITKWSQTISAVCSAFSFSVSRLLSEDSDPASANKCWNSHAVTNVAG